MLYIRHDATDSSNQYLPKKIEEKIMRQEVNFYQ